MAPSSVAGATGANQETGGALRQEDHGAQGKSGYGFEKK